MDRHDASWILGFILRQPIEDRLVAAILRRPIEDRLAAAILRAIPTPAPVHPHLAKALLIRRLGSDLSKRRVSEETLRCLELVEEIDRSQGKRPLEAIKGAYYAVAVECTVMALRESGGRDPGDFFGAVNRIWNCRVADMELSAARGLVSSRLKMWRGNMEDAVTDPDLRSFLLKFRARGEALYFLDEYLRYAEKEMGPPLLQLMAEAVSTKVTSSKGKDLETVESSRAASTRMVTSRAGASGVPAERHVPDGANVVELDSPSSEMASGVAEAVSTKATTSKGKTLDTVESSSRATGTRVTSRDVNRAGASGVPEEWHVPDGANAVELDHPSSEMGTERYVLSSRVTGRAGASGVSAGGRVPNGANVVELDHPSLERGTERNATSSRSTGRDGASGFLVEPHVPNGANIVELDIPSSEMNTERNATSSKAAHCAGVSGVPVERPVPDGANEVELDHPSSEMDIERMPRVEETETRIGSVLAKQTYVSNQSEPTCNEFHHLPISEVDKVKGALKSSCVDLHKVVEDPLPNALGTATEVQSRMTEKPVNLNYTVQNENLPEVNAPGPISVDKGVQVTSTEGIVAKKMPHVNPVDRNRTAQTYERDEVSSESPSERSPHSSKQRNLPTPKNRVVSPLKVKETTKFVRRKNKRWTPLEEDTLREGVKKHGRGSWKVILNSYSSVFEDRTEVDLKDKWRNMTRW